MEWVLNSHGNNIRVDTEYLVEAVGGYRYCMVLKICISVLNMVLPVEKFQKLKPLFLILKNM